MKNYCLSVLALWLFDFAFFLDEHTNIVICLTILVQMSLLEQLLSSEEHEWKEDTCCVCMDLFVSGGFPPDGLCCFDSPVLPHTDTQG